MTKIEIVYFAVILFCALVALTKWKQRREAVAGRLNRGLQSYVCRESEPIEESEDDLLAIQ
jgi:hypothetical protein